MIAGKVAGRYRLTAQLGSGAWFTVFHAVDPSSNQPLVVKVVHDFLLSRRRLVDRLEALLRRRTTLTHPGLVAVYEVNHDNDGLWTVEEHVSGRSMIPGIETGTVDEHRGPRIMVEVLDALSYVHDAGFVHGCVHPGAIRLTDSDKPKVGDLGFMVTDPGMIGPRMSGTLEYHRQYGAPELHVGTTPTVAGDIYSAGVLLGRCVGLDRRGDGSAPLTAWQRTVAAVVRRACVPDPAHRYPSAKEMAVELRTCLRSS